MRPKNTSARDGPGPGGAPEPGPGPGSDPDPGLLPRPLDRLPADLRARLRPAPRDRTAAAVPPMLATPSDRRSFDERWLFERKLDGVRALAVRGPGGVTLLSRRGNVMDATYPEVTAAVAAQDLPDFTVDGEIVALRAGRTDFALLQQRMGLTDPRAVAASPVTVVYYVFDLLNVAGYDTTFLPLRTRKALLRDTLAFHAPLRFTTHRNHADLGEACAKGWEGLIAKRADAPYEPRRSTHWLKLKCTAGQEFVIGGYTEPAGTRTGLGALLLGYYEGGGAGGDGVGGGGGPGSGGAAGPGGGDGGTARRLRYAGKVGTGFTRTTLTALRTGLDSISRPDSPFADPVPRSAGTPHWTDPRVVAQIAFTEWTRDGLLRHPRFLGLRDDKRPTDVIREGP